MQNELKQKLFQIIENNFSKSESEVLVKLVQERDRLVDENERYKEGVQRLGQSIDAKTEEIRKLESSMDEYRKDAAKANQKASECEKLYNEMKASYVDLELRVTKESLNNIFKLTKIAFRTPKKITEFNENITTNTYDYSTGRPSGSCITSHPVRKIESQE